jgi:hypothetical protein
MGRPGHEPYTDTRPKYHTQLVASFMHIWSKHLFKTASVHNFDSN